MLSAAYPQGTLTLDDTHTYRLGDTVVPGNTSILKDMGVIDDTYYNLDAAARGTAVHELTSLYCQYKGDFHFPSVDERYRGYCIAWDKFIKESGFKTVLNEFPVLGDGYATTVDRVGEMNGRCAVLEIKTGTVPKWVGLQTAMQQAAVVFQHKTLGLTPVARFAVNLRPDGSYKFSVCDGFGDTRDAMSLVAAWHVRKRYRRDVPW